MIPPPLSIVIPCHHRVELLHRCLASVSRHAPPGTEIIVVDDGSPGAIVQTATVGFRDVRVIRLPKSRGFCAAANAGITAVRAPVIELLNDDTEVIAGWAEAALARFADPGIIAVAPLVLRWREQQVDAGPRLDGSEIIDSAGDDYDWGGFARKRCHGERFSEAHVERCEVFGASASSAFYRRDALVRAGQFPDEFRAYFEDVDLSLRLRRLGRIVYEPSSCVRHRGGGSYGRPSRRLLELQSCNEERVFWRNLSNAELLRRLPRHLAVLAGKAWRRLDEGTAMPWLLGRVRAWCEVPQCRRHAKRLDRLGTLRQWPDFDPRIDPAAGARTPATIAN